MPSDAPRTGIVGGRAEQPGGRTQNVRFVAAAAPSAIDDESPQSVHRCLDPGARGRRRVFSVVGGRPEGARVGSLTVLAARDTAHQ